MVVEAADAAAAAEAAATTAAAGDAAAAARLTSLQNELAAATAAVAARDADIRIAVDAKARDDEVIRTLTDELCVLQNSLRARSADFKSHEVKKERLYRMVNEISKQR